MDLFICGSCREEKPLAVGEYALAHHYRWSPAMRLMETCPGSGHPPVPPNANTTRDGGAR